jgi:hypothetical protein
MLGRLGIDKQATVTLDHAAVRREGVERIALDRLAHPVAYREQVVKYDAHAVRVDALTRVALIESNRELHLLGSFSVRGGRLGPIQGYESRDVYN